jgi:hypothetical protein
MSNYAVHLQNQLQATLAERDALRASLQAIVDCYGVGTHDPERLLAHLGHFILEAREKHGMSKDAAA